MQERCGSTIVAVVLAGLKIAQEENPTGQLHAVKCPSSGPHPLGVEKVVYPFECRACAAPARFVVCGFLCNVLARLQCFSQFNMRIKYTMIAFVEKSSCLLNSTLFCNIFRNDSEGEAALAAERI